MKILIDLFQNYDINVAFILQLKQQLDEKRKEVESMECRLAPLRQNISAAKNKFQQMQREVATQVMLIILFLLILFL